MNQLTNFCVRCRQFQKGKFMSVADFVCDPCIDEQHTIYLLQQADEDQKGGNR